MIPLNSLLMPAILILVPLATGILARYFQLFESFFDILYKIVIILILPALVFGSVAVNPELRYIGILSFGEISILALICIGVTSLVSLGGSYWFGMSREKSTEILLNGAFMNYTFLGLAVVQSTIGTGALAYASIFAVTVGIIHLTIGMGLTRISAGEEVRAPEVLYDILSFPAVFALIVALLFVGFEVGIPYWDFAQGLMDDYANVASFVMVLATAYKMEIGPIKKYLTSLSIVGMIRLVLGPLVTYAAIKQLGFSGVIARVALLLSAMPPGIFNLILADRFDLDRESYSIEIFYLTLISLFVVVPLILLFVFPVIP